MQRAMDRQGYPVARPLLREESSDLLGGPFLIMEKVPGRTLFEMLLRKPWLSWIGAKKMAELQHRLHSLPVKASPGHAESLLERRFDDMREAMQVYDLHGLRAGYDWLVERRPPEPRRPCVVHLDFHPVNLVGDGLETMAVLDWSEAAVGDYHADVATTLMLMRCCSVEKTSWLDRRILPIGRLFLSRWYLRCYGWRAPLDKQKLAYYKALAALSRLCRYCRWLRAAPALCGCKPSSLRLLTPSHLQTVQTYFWRQTGVAVEL